MKFPKTPEDIVNEIYISSDKCKKYGYLRVRQLIRVLSEVADDILVEAVVQVFAGSKRVESSFLDQEIAGRVLEERKPFTDIQLDKLIERCLAGWNKSVEQFPFWLVEVYGIGNIRAALLILENKSLSKTEREKLATMRWWIHNVG